jgi:hypothetical protein
VLALAGGGSAGPSAVTPGAVWPGFDSLPAETRALVHPNARQLPRFPNDNPGLLSVGRWPASLVDSGRICRLELSVYPRGVRVPIRDLKQRRAGQALTARYLCSSRGWRAPLYAGPSYAWNGYDALEERSYRETDGKRFREDLYQYRANGLTWAYRRRERSEDLTGPSLTVDEYFDPDGKLAGFQVVRADSDSVTVQWRRGTPVSAGQFREWVAAFAPR